MKNKKGLGKGLQALIPEEKVEAGKGVSKVDIDRVCPNKNQPRTKFDQDKLEELANSIREHGVIQPMIVTVFNDGYKIVAGERRWRAAKIAGIKEVPVVIRELTEKDIMELALIENLQREDLNEIEEALAYKDLMNKFQLTQQDISTRIGKSRTAIANTLRLLKLPSNIRSLIVDGIITPGHGRCILSTEGFEREKLLEKILKDKLSVRDSERLAQKLKSNKEKIETQKKELNSKMFLRDIEDRMQKNLGTKVVIKGKSEKGKIEIEYYSNDDLERLTEMLSN